MEKTAVIREPKVRKMAQIESVSLGFEDHGIFTVSLNFRLAGGSTYQSGGQMMLSYSPKENNYKPVGSPGGIDFLIGILRACHVDTWEKLPGRKVYVLYDDDRLNSYIRGIQSLEIDGDEIFWFDQIKLWPDNES